MSVVAKHCGTFCAESVSCPGRRLVPTFSESYDDDGVYTVIESGSFDIQDQINSFKDDCDIYCILRKVGSGETELLDKRVGSYLDVTSLPSNLHEAHKVMVQSQDFFNSLPLDVRLLYNNNYRQFVADFGSERFLSIFSQKEAPSPTVVSDISNDKTVESEA